MTSARSTFVGIDLAWGERASTGLATVDAEGRLTASGVARTNDEIDAWLAAHAQHPDASGASRPLCIEVYPHPALVGLFELPQRILYKKGPDRRPGFEQLAGCLESIGQLQLDKSERWQAIRAIIAAPRPGDLNRIEDEMDAILCAHLAWLWRHLRSALHVYGSVAEGYIVAPPPPTH